MIRKGIRCHEVKMLEQTETEKDEMEKKSCEGFKKRRSSVRWIYRING